MRGIILAASAALSLFAEPLRGQAAQVRVAVEITDEKAGGIFSSAFRSAVRSLPGVLVVAEDDRPDVVFSAVVVCTGSDCATTSSYAVALLTTVPLNRSAIYLALRRSGLQPAQVRVATDSVYRRLRWYSQVGDLSVATWGRNRYESAILEYVRELDANCLEQFRLLAKENLTPSESRRLDETKWEC